MTTYAKRKLKYSRNENFNLLQYVEWDRFATLAGSKNGLWDYVIVSRFIGARTVTIPCSGCTLNLSINLERGISESSREAKLLIKRWTTPRSPPTSPSIMNGVPY